MSFTNKTAIVTGAATGIGKATALLLARKGAAVVVSDIQSDAGQETVETINREGGKARFIACDVARPEQVAHLIQQTVERFGSLDIMVNNAGVGPRRQVRTAEASLDDWDQVIAVNQSGVFYGMKYALQQMVRQASGSIVNIASLAGLKASSHNISYSASKFAVVGMTKSAALEYARMGIRINAVCPGYTSTNLFNSLLESREDMDQRLRKLIPMRRYGKPEEIAGAVAYLCQEDAGFITGQTLVLDGGISL